MLTKVLAKCPGGTIELEVSRVGGIHFAVQDFGQAK